MDAEQEFHAGRTMRRGSCPCQLRKPGPCKFRFDEGTFLPRATPARAAIDLHRQPTRSLHAEAGAKQPSQYLCDWPVREMRSRHLPREHSASNRIADRDRPGLQIPVSGGSACRVACFSFKPWRLRTCLHPERIRFRVSSKLWGMVAMVSIVASQLRAVKSRNLCYGTHCW